MLQPRLCARALEARTRFRTPNDELLDGAVKLGVHDARGLYPPFPTLPLPLSKVAVLALRDLQRQIATTYAATPCMKRAMQAVVGVAMWLLTAVVIVPTLFHPDVTGFATVVLLAILFVWTPGVIAYTWATAPSAPPSSHACA